VGRVYIQVLISEPWEAPAIQLGLISTSKYDIWVGLSIRGMCYHHLKLSAIIQLKSQGMI
jgi:hypothetical protein